MAKKKTYRSAVLDVEKIKSLRENAGLTQDQAGKAAGFSGRQWWHNIESGSQQNIELATLGRIADVLGVSPKELLK